MGELDDEAYCAAFIWKQSLKIQSYIPNWSFEIDIEWGKQRDKNLRRGMEFELRLPAYGFCLLLMKRIPYFSCVCCQILCFIWKFLWHDHVVLECCFFQMLVWLNLGTKASLLYLERLKNVLWAWFYENIIICSIS